MKSKVCALDENMKTKGIGADSWALQCLSCLPLSHAWIGAQCSCVIKGDTHACNQRVFRTGWSVDLNKEWNEARSRTLMCDVVYLVRVGHLPHLKFPRQKSSCRLSLVSCLHRTSLFSTLWSRTGGGRMAKVDGCTGWEYKNHQQFPRGFCRVAFAGWLLHKGAFVSPEMEQDKGHKGTSRHRRHLDICCIWQQLRCNRVCQGTKVLPIGSEEAGRCLNTFAALGLNLPSKDSSNNSVTEGAHMHLWQDCVPSLTCFLWLSRLSIPCQFTSARFASLFLTKHPGLASGAAIAHAYKWPWVGESPSILCVCSTFGCIRWAENPGKENLIVVWRKIISHCKNTLFSQGIQCCLSQRWMHKLWTFFHFLLPHQRGSGNEFPA